jgi:membrane-bound lytic murein transglycosylase D
LGLFGFLSRLRTSPRFRNVEELFALLVVVCLGVIAFVATFDIATTRQEMERELERLHDRVQQLEHELVMLKDRPRFMYSLPETITFCGQIVPLDSTDVRERIETELLLYLDKPGQLALMRKRAARVFPVFERVLWEWGLPDDLKYVSIVESALRPGAVSWAGASGYWQFIPSTAARYGLKVGDVVDERNLLEKATRAAAAYFSDLYRMFGDWFLACAAYNTGEGSVYGARRVQGVRSYWDMRLARETEQYVPRIVAAKVIFSDLERYVARIESDDGFVDYVTVPVEVHLSTATTLADVARRIGVPVRELVRRNPHLRKSRLPSGDYWLYVPERAVDRTISEYGA